MKTLRSHTSSMAIKHEHAQVSTTSQGWFWPFHFTGYHCDVGLQWKHASPSLWLYRLTYNLILTHMNYSVETFISRAILHTSHTPTSCRIFKHQSLSWFIVCIALLLAIEIRTKKRSTTAGHSSQTLDVNYMYTNTHTFPHIHTYGVCVLFFWDLAY